MKRSEPNHSATKKNLPGIWLGIDLGTTNTTAAFYSPNNHVAKLIRFTPTYASVQKKNDKYGKILPSAVYFEKGEVDCIGKSALLKTQSVKENGTEYDDVNKSITSSTPTGNTHEKHSDNEEKNIPPHDNRGVLLTSVKRIWGMDTIQIKDEIHSDESFLNSCPFQTTWIDDELRIITTDVKDETKTTKNHDHIDIDQKKTIAPIDVAEILLRTIREEAQKYFIRERRKKKHVPLGLDSSSNNIDKVYDIRHCIITIPAHFSRNQKEKVIQAARKAGFDGYVNTLVESTAAAMAYGLFVSPTKIVKSSNQANRKESFEEQHGSKILVCDIGGGTTDITIAEMTSAMDNYNGDEIKSSSNEPSFHVLTTAGERRLGGDDMDESLAQFVMRKNTEKGDKDHYECKLNKEEWNKLLMSCRHAKESLCGDNSRDIVPLVETTVSVEFDHYKIDVTINQSDFEKVIEPFIEKVEQLAHKTLERCQLEPKSIDEVILVGGATRTPAIRKMLQKTFPKNELCFSIDADAAVAQGAAIQCAVISGLVPKHELRNAMMLDALPHTIGVLISCDGDGEMYVPILKSGLTLPAMNYATFRLADVRQKGVTIIAVEDVGEDLPLQKIGEFTFLLHRLTEKDIGLLDDGVRCIDVGMTVDADAKFIVSIFDKNDPDDLVKKHRYQQWKQRQEGKIRHDDTDDQIHTLGKANIKDISVEQTRSATTPEEIFLFISCLSLLGFYLLVRLLFHEPGEDGSKII